jgi:hypothetical protein
MPRFTNLVIYILETLTTNFTLAHGTILLVVIKYNFIDIRKWKK